MTGMDTPTPSDARWREAHAMHAPMIVAELRLAAARPARPVSLARRIAQHIVDLVDATGACTEADLARRFDAAALRRDLPEARRLVERLRPIYREAA